MYGRISNAEMGNYSPRGALALCMIPSHSGIGRWSWGFHIVRGRIDPGDRRFRHRFVGVEEVWKDFEPWRGSYPPSHGATGPELFPKGQLPPRAPCPLIGRGRAGGAPRPMSLWLGKRWIENRLPILYYNGGTLLRALTYYFSAPGSQS